MKISIVVPAFNEKDTLTHLRRSLQKQNFSKEDFEVIIVDNNSTDDTVQIAKQFHVRVISETRQGITFARDTGAKAARFEIISCIDADCVLPKNYLRTIHTVFSKDKKLAAYCGFISFYSAPLAVKVMAKVLSWYVYSVQNIFHKMSFCSAANF